MRVALHGVVCIWRLSCAAAIITMLLSWKGQLRVQGSWPLLLPDPINTTPLLSPTTPSSRLAYRGGVLATVARFVWGRQNAEVAGCEGSCCDVDQLHMDVGFGGDSSGGLLCHVHCCSVCAHRAESDIIWLACCVFSGPCAHVRQFCLAAEMNGCVAGAAVLLLMLLLFGAAAL